MLNPRKQARYPAAGTVAIKRSMRAAANPVSTRRAEESILERAQFYAREAYWYCMCSTNPGTVGPRASVMRKPQVAVNNNQGRFPS